MILLKNLIRKVHNNFFKNIFMTTATKKQINKQTSEIGERNE
jgi:hypothetical protein